MVSSLYVCQSLWCKTANKAYSPNSLVFKLKCKPHFWESRSTVECVSSFIICLHCISLILELKVQFAVFLFKIWIGTSHLTRVGWYLTVECPSWSLFFVYIALAWLSLAGAPAHCLSIEDLDSVLAISQELDSGHPLAIFLLKIWDWCWQSHKGWTVVTRFPSFYWRSGIGASNLARVGWWSPTNILFLTELDG